MWILQPRSVQSYSTENDELDDIEFLRRNFHKVPESPIQLSASTYNHHTFFTVLIRQQNPISCVARSITTLIEIDQQQDSRRKIFSHVLVSQGTIQTNTPTIAEQPTKVGLLQKATTEWKSGCFTADAL